MSGLKKMSGGDENLGINFVWPNFRLNAVNDFIFTSRHNIMEAS